MLTRTKRLAARTTTAVTLAGALIATSTGAAHAQDELGESSAFGVESTLTDAALPPTPQAQYPGGPSDAFAGVVNVGPYGALTILAAEASGADGSVEAAAAVGSSTLLFVEDVVGDTAFTSGLIAAECSAEAEGEPEGDAVLANAVYTGLDGGGVPFLEAFDAEPAPNTVVDLEDGTTAHLNEQTTDADGGLTVNALRLDFADHPVIDGDITIASAYCLPGSLEELPPPVETGSLGVSAENAKTGKSVKNVVINAYAYPEANNTNGNWNNKKLLPPPSTFVGSCVTGWTGTCEINELDPGYYTVCVADVPEGYKLPKKEKRCLYPVFLESGEHLELESFLLWPDDRDKKRYY